MLSKKLCIKCLNKKAPIWNPTDESNWEEGFVNCRSVSVSHSPGDLGGMVTTYGREAKIKDPPPEWCPYRFRQAVAAGMKKC